MATRFFERRGSIRDGDGRRVVATAFVIERDTERPGTVEVVRSSDRAEIEAELGEGVLENAPWMLRRISDDLTLLARQLHEDRWRL